MSNKKDKRYSLNIRYNSAEARDEFRQRLVGLSEYEGEPYVDIVERITRVYETLKYNTSKLENTRTIEEKADFITKVGMNMLPGVVSDDSPFAFDIKEFVKYHIIDGWLSLEDLDDIKEYAKNFDNELVGHATANEEEKALEILFNEVPISIELFTLDSYNKVPVGYIAPKIEVKCLESFRLISTNTSANHIGTINMSSIVENRIVNFTMATDVLLSDLIDDLRTLVNTKEARLEILKDNIKEIRVAVNIRTDRYRRGPLQTLFKTAQHIVVERKSDLKGVIKVSTIDRGGNEL